MNKSFFTTLATAATLVTSSILPGFTPQVKADYAVDPAHQQLIAAVRSTGIQFILNGQKCEEEGDSFHGYYWAAKNEFVICQDYRSRADQHQVRWTNNDLDTLRHEAQHVIQDCMNGHYRDGRLGAVYRDPIGLAKNVLGGATIAQILDAYSDVDDHTKVMELEAFSVAALNDPLEQVRDIQKFCF